MDWGSLAKDVGVFLAGVAFNEVLWRYRRRIKRDDDATDRREARVREAGRDLGSLVEGWLAEVASRSDGVGFGYLTARKSNVIALNRAVVELSTVLDARGRARLDHFVGELRGPEAKAERETAERAGQDLLAFLAELH